MVDTSAPLAIDLFSGCGGLTQGLKQAGFNVCAAIELELGAVRTYQLNHPEVAIRHADIRDVCPKKLRRCLCLRKGKLDLLAGCPPCQGFSPLRTLNGSRPVSDERNELVFEFVRFAEEFKPKTIMLENVPGLASDFRFAEFLASIAVVGYDIKWDVLNAADFAVPQRRKRLIVLASRIGSIPFARKARKKIFVADAIRNLPPPGNSGDELHDFPERRALRIRRLIRSIPKNGGSRKDLPNSLQLTCHRKCNGFKDVYGRMSWDDFSPTITTGCFNPSKGRFLHPEQDRNISLREAALLQTFPKTYCFSDGLGKEEIASLIGNALPPEFIRRHAIQVKRCIENQGIHSHGHRKT